MRHLALLLLAGSGIMAGQDSESTVVYSFGFLKSAPGWVSLPAEEAKTLQAAHLKHMAAMHEKGALVAAGPLMTGGVLRGIVIYKTPLRQSVEMADADPIVKRGQLVAELHSWRATAGIGERYAQERKANPGLGDKMIRVPLILLRGQGSPESAIAALRKTATVRVAGVVLDDGELRAAIVLAATLIDDARASAESAAKLANLQAEVHEWLVADGVLP
jgi:uncharacterized protein YciI